VVSRAAPDRGHFGCRLQDADVGHRRASKEHGLILEHPEAKIARFCRGARFFSTSPAATPAPLVGDVVRIVPNHVCVVVNMVDEVVMVRGDEIIGTLPVAARGKIEVGE